MISEAARILTVTPLSRRIITENASVELHAFSLTPPSSRIITY